MIYLPWSDFSSGERVGSSAKHNHQPRKAEVIQMMVFNCFRDVRKGICLVRPVFAISYEFPGFLAAIQTFSR